MKKSLLVLLSVFLSLILFSCATSNGDKPRAEIGGEITLVGTTPGLEMEIKIPFDSEKKDETTVEPTEEAETTPIIEVEEPYKDTLETIDTPKEVETLDITTPSITEEETNSVTVIGGADAPTDIIISDSPTIIEPKEEVISFSPIDTSDLFSLFNYAYGLKTLDDIKSENISLNAKYFARAVIDASFSPIPVLVESGKIQSTIDQYVLEYYYEGKTFLPGDRPDSISELLTLDKPSTLEEAFSYAYTFSIIRELIDGEVDILPEPFIIGGLDSLTESERLLDIEGEQNAINAYITYLNEEYLKEIEKKGETNSDRAKAFLEENGKRDGVVVLDNGIELMILDEDDKLGDHPTQYDTVLVDYNMYVMDYDTEELEIIDADYYAELRLMEIDTALQSSIVALRVGQAGRTWVPPEMLYGERNIEGIEPNSIIVYDIALHDIL
ncbi:MAG: hypothetical protein MR687_05515 [Spirochaetales bacterium]|nr:hypothetical protein [Spirochaetales bacterium]